jgi:hypothetical protein
MAVGDLLAELTGFERHGAAQAAASVGMAHEIVSF